MRADKELDDYVVYLEGLVQEQRNTIDNQKEEIRTIKNSLREEIQKNANLKQVATDVEKVFEGARKELAAAVRNN